MHIVLGVVSAFIGGFLFDALSRAGVTGINLYNMFIAIGGAVVMP